MMKVYNPKDAPTNIQQPYAFTEQLLSFDFNIYELRVLFRILELIKVNQKHNISVQIDIENNIELLFPVSVFMIPGHKNNDDIRSAIKSLREKSITNISTIEVEIDGVLETLSADQFLGVIENPKWAHNNSFVSLKLNEAWYRFLGDLSRGYTQYLSSVAFSCSSPETVKIYQFVNQWFKSKGKTLKLTNFKKEFNIPKSYTISRIVERFLDPAKKELDTIADRSFNYTLFYDDGSIRDPKNPIRGKRTNKITFVFYNNHKNKKLYELSDYDHREAQKWMKQIQRRYSLSEINIKILYTLIKRYSLPYFITSEKEARNHLKSFKGDDFINKLAAIVRKEGQ